MKGLWVGILLVTVCMTQNGFAESAGQSGSPSKRAWKCEIQDDNFHPVRVPNPQYRPEFLTCAPELPLGMAVLEKQDGSIRMESLVGGAVVTAFECRLVESLTKNGFLVFYCVDRSGIGFGTIEFNLNQPEAGYFYTGPNLPKEGVESEGFKLFCEMNDQDPFYDIEPSRAPNYCDPEAEKRVPDEVRRRHQEQLKKMAEELERAGRQGI